MSSYLTYLFCFAAGFVVCWGVTPLVIRLAFRLGAVDRPANRKIHGRVTARMGGIGLFLGMWVPMTFLFFYSDVFALKLLTNDRHLFLILMGGLSMFVLGIIDDFHGLGSKIKFGFQFPVAVILVLGGARFDAINFPFLGHVELGALGPFVSILWLVGVTNAVNLIDGVDGLASGVAYLVTLAIATLSIYSGQYFLAVVMCCIAGACLGFLQYNFSPARIFLGDSGSLFLGMTLAVSSTLCSYKETVGTSLIIPAILMGYPIADTMLAMLRRYVSGKPMFSGDAGHIHHRLLRKGLDHKQVCWVIYTVTVTFCLWTFVIEKRQTVLIIVGALVNLSLFILGLYHLGYFAHFTSSKVKVERSQFKAAHFFSEMVKAKLVLANSQEDVVALLKQASLEYKQSLFEIGFKSESSANSKGREEETLKKSLIGKTGNLPRSDRYSFENTGLNIKVIFASGGESEELITERRMLFGELCKISNQRLLEISEVEKSHGENVTMDKDPSEDMPSIKQG